MAQNCVKVRVNPSLGKSIAGEFWVPIPEAGLNEAQLEHLNCALCLYGDNPGHYLEVDEPDWDGVERAIEAKLASKEAEKQRYAAEEEERIRRRQESNAAVLDIITKVDRAIASPNDSDFLKRELQWEGYYIWNYGWPSWPSFAGTDKADPEHKELRDQAKARLADECKRRNATAIAAEQARADAMSDTEFELTYGVGQARLIGRFERLEQIVFDRAAAARAVEQAEQRACLVGVSEEILERFDAGVLPEGELKVLLAEHFFGSIESLAARTGIRQALFAYQSLRNEDLQCECGSAPKFKSEPYEGEMTAEQWKRWKRIREVFEPQQLAPELRRHAVYCTECKARTTRLSARVTKTIGGIQVRRLYQI